jgi:hypothetical protein
VLPSVIDAEMRRLPVGFLEQILEYRAYRQAKAANDAHQPGWESSTIRTLAQQIEFESVKKLPES